MNIILGLILLGSSVLGCWYLLRRVNDWRNHVNELMAMGYIFRFRRQKIKGETSYIAEFIGEDGSVSAYDVDANSAVWKAIRNLREEL